MKKFLPPWYWIRWFLALGGLFFEAVSMAQIFLPNTAFDLLKDFKFTGVVNLGFSALLIQWIFELKRAEYKHKSLKPIMSVKKFGVEEKPLYKTVGLNDGMGGVGTIKIDYDTLYIEVINKHRDVKRVWSWVEWFDTDMHLLFSHQGRWHIIKPENEEKKENLQYVDLYSNSHPERLHFACINKSNYQGYFTGLERDKGGKEDWDNPKYRLYGPDGYIVRITLQGNEDVKQSFIYIVDMRDGKFDIAPGSMWGIDKIPMGDAGN